MNGLSSFSSDNCRLVAFILLLRSMATEESNVVTYEVFISAHNPDLKLKPGLTANITIYDDLTRFPFLPVLYPNDFQAVVSGYFLLRQIFRFVAFFARWRIGNESKGFELYIHDIAAFGGVNGDVGGYPGFNFKSGLWARMETS